MASCLWDLVGNTPLLRVRSLSELTGCEIYAKAEHLNPGGSVKDRAAKHMIAGAEARGALRPGGTLVEGTAGNTGIGLAMLGAERGYRVVVTMPDNQAKEKYDILEALGADVRRVPVVPFANQAHFYHQAKHLAAEHHWFWVNQFENLDNSLAHETTTGPEIVAQAGRAIDYFTCSVGSGGTISGISRALKAANPATRVVLVDPAGSGLYAWFTTGQLASEGSSITEGIGIMRITENFRSARVDEALRFDDQALYEMMLHVGKTDGLVVGPSSALNLRAAYELGLRHRGEGKLIVTLICDQGGRYLSKLADPQFLASKGLRARSLDPAPT